MASLTIREIMTAHPVSLPASASAFEAAQAMRDSDIGTVVITDGDKIKGIVTDRDIVIRATAEGKDPKQVKLGDICSKEVTSLSPSDTLDLAVKLMREKHLRRLVVVDSAKPVGIISLGDLAVRLDRSSALADISSAQANH